MSIVSECYLSATDWLSQMHVKNYCNFLRAMMFFSVVENPIEHFSLYNN